MNACKVLKFEEVPAELKEYSDLLVIESNRYRDKTWGEKLKEEEALERILKPKAEAREKAGKKVDPMQNSSQGKTREQTAKAVGTSHEQLRKYRVVKKAKPKLIKAIDDGRRTVNSAYNQIQN